MHQSLLIRSLSLPRLFAKPPFPLPAKHHIPTPNLPTNETFNKGTPFALPPLRTNRRTRNLFLPHSHAEIDRALGANESALKASIAPLY
ncbi:hypothetical protein H8D30_00215 [bacterium]|nr:hypothetical protein [bacterium]